MEPSNEELIEFYDRCIMQGKSFRKTYKIKDLSIVLRTRKSKEVSTIFKKIKNETGLDAVRLINDYNLAFSLVSIGKTEYDKGTLEERVEVLEEMDSTMKAILWDLLSDFNTFVEKMRKQHINFLNA